MKGHSVHYTELRTVEELVDGKIDIFVHRSSNIHAQEKPVITKENCRQVMYPRTQRARQRVKEIETRLEHNMMKKFDGLNDDQREAIMRIVKRNSKVRQLASKDRPLRERMAMLSEESLADDSIINPFDFADSFPIHKYELQSKKAQVEASGEVAEKPKKDTTAGEPVVEATKVEPNCRVLSPKSKYSTFIDRRSRSLRKIELVVREDSNQGLTQMKNVTQSLHRWAQDTLDSPVCLLEPTPAPVVETKSPIIAAIVNQTQASIQPTESDGSATAQSSPTTGNPPILGNRPMSQDASAGEFDILLNACKPSILETKPPIRVNVSQEDNPPHALIASIKENFGATFKEAVFERATPYHQPKLERQVAMNNHYNQETKYRAKYGAWYVKPSKWHDFMKKSNGEDEDQKKLTAAKEKKFGGLVQQKLDEIVANRAKEELKLQQSPEIDSDYDSSSDTGSDIDSDNDGQSFNGDDEEGSEHGSEFATKITITGPL
ncbi:hypothetical protein HDV05_000994 [Chytridiales sp. JEL 0842]|nr:hypothetical protein HDV05_000994 [Chytridiales sp. JEL 0842]